VCLPACHPERSEGSQCACQPVILSEAKDRSVIGRYDPSFRFAPLRMTAFKKRLRIYDLQQQKGPWRGPFQKAIRVSVYA
jgi:hypothetical protein